MEVVQADSNGIQRALEVLREGGVIAHATETCYGLACDLKNLAAVEKLFAIKERPLNQPVSALFASVDDAKNCVEWNDEAEELAKKYLPGPLTIILPMKAGCPLRPSASPSPSATLGIRVSSSTFATTLVHEFGSPISTTSANVHGQPNPYSAEDMKNQFAGKKFQPDLILDSGELPKTPPSTVINLTNADREVRRQGSLKMGQK